VEIKTEKQAIECEKASAFGECLNTDEFVINLYKERQKQKVSA